MFGKVWAPKGTPTVANVSKLYPTQDGISAKRVFSLYSSIQKEGMKEMPSALKVGDKFYVFNGHHRVAAEIIAGKKIIKLRFVEVSQKTFDDALKKVKKSKT